MDKHADKSWMVAWALVQGAGFWALHGVRKQWEPVALWPLYVLLVAVPVALQLLSAHRGRRLLWGLAALLGAVLSGAAAYAGHGVVTEARGQTIAALVVLLPACWFVLLPFMDQRLSLGTWSSDYAHLFATAWRHAFQLLLAGLFTGLFWALLLLLAGLFKVLGVSLFFDAFTSAPFIYLATPLAWGVGLSLYAAREEALAGFWRSMLQVLGWLLPLACLIALLFLLALPLRGLAPLWQTGKATALMLGLMLWLVFLFNVAWSDGEEAHQRFGPRLQRFIAAGLLTLPVYAALCSYALGLRVVQYGWSVDRVWAALAIGVLAIYAVGYSVAALWRQGPWMALAQRVNVGAAWTAVALVLLTWTPLLDPARIAVASQLARLQAQQVDAQAFDFVALRWDAGRRGRIALEQLRTEQQHPQAAQIRELAEAALQDSYLHARRQSAGEPTQWTADRLRDRLKPVPPTAELDAAWLDFLLARVREHKWSFPCTDSRPCPVLTVDLDGDGQPEQVLLSGYASRVFTREAGQWREAGALAGRLERLHRGQGEPDWMREDVTTTPPRWRELVIGGERYTVRPSD